MTKQRLNYLKENVDQVTEKLGGTRTDLWQNDCVYKLAVAIKDVLIWINRHDFDFLCFEDKPQTTDYCDVCNHKGCDNCVADGSNPYCVPSQFDKDINVRSKDEPQNCDTCRHHFSKDYYDIECEAKAFGNECKLKPKDEPQKWEKPPKFEHKGIQTACVSVPMALIEDEPQTNADQHVQHVGSVESVEPTWTKEEHEAFYTFLWNVINPNEMQDYIEMFETKDEPQTECPQANICRKPCEECGVCKEVCGMWKKLKKGEER